MAYTVERNIVVPSGYAQRGGGFVAPFRQIHLHSTANPSAPLDNEVAYLSRNYPNGNYTHLVGENGRVIQVAEVGQGAWDVGGDWNAETYAAIEFGEKVTSQDDFNKSYGVYVELARDLAKQAGIPLTLDTPDISGIKTHNYVSRIGHGSDHTDPIDFLSKWGVSYDQLKHDIENGFSTATKDAGKQQEEQDMFTISAKGRGIALMQGGVFLPFLNAQDPANAWANGIKNVELAPETFDRWQGNAAKSTLDDATVAKLVAGMKK